MSSEALLALCAMRLCVVQHLCPQLQAAQAALDVLQAESLSRAMEAKATQTAARAAQWADGAADSDSDSKAAAVTGLDDDSGAGSGPLLAAAGETAGGHMPARAPYHAKAAAAEVAAAAAEPGVATEPQLQAQGAAGSAVDSGADETASAAVHAAAPWQTSVPAAQQRQSPPEGAAEQDTQLSSADSAPAAATVAAAAAAEQPAEEAPQEKRWVWENGRRVLA